MCSVSGWPPPRTRFWRQAAARAEARLGRSPCICAAAPGSPSRVRGSTRLPAVHDILAEQRAVGREVFAAPREAHRDRPRHESPLTARSVAAVPLRGPKSSRRRSRPPRAARAAGRSGQGRAAHLGAVIEALRAAWAMRPAKPSINAAGGFPPEVPSSRGGSAAAPSGALAAASARPSNQQRLGSTWMQNSHRAYFYMQSSHTWRAKSFRKLRLDTSLYFRLRRGRPPRRRARATDG